MADIELTCPGCGNKTTVSEYVTNETIACPTCNQQLQITRQKKSSSLKFKKNIPAVDTPESDQPAETAPALPSTASAVRPFKLRAARKRPRRIIITIFGWLIFIVLAGSLIYLRQNGQVLTGIPLPLLIQGGMTAIGVSYLITVSIALKDDIFHGLLCLAVPGYVYYYLFLVSGAVFLRAITAALLLAFGFDLAILVQDVALKVFDTVNHWIEHAAD